MTSSTTKNARRILTRGLLLLGLATLALTTSASSADAGQWVQVVCETPAHAAASSQGWSSFVGGAPGYGSNSSAGCSPGNPMFAELGAAGGGEPVGSSEDLHYQPPAGSTLAGGSIDLSLWGDGAGYGASGDALAYTPAFEYNGSNVFVQCSSAQPACGSAGAPYDFSGVLGIPANRGGNLYVSASCGGINGQSCTEHADLVNGWDAYAIAEVHWADLLLSSSATPGASGIGGTLLSSPMRGSGELVLTANDPGGPGVYTIDVQADSTTIYDATPDTNGGMCVPVGSSGGALMFAYSQPCKTSESIDIVADTTRLADGQHTLKVSVVDAAGNTSTVYSGHVTTHNAPEDSSAPTIIAPAQVTSGATLTAQPGGWSAPTGAGAITYSYQWEACDSQGQSCQAIIGATSSSYTLSAANVGQTVRVQVTATDSDGYTPAVSRTSPVVSSPAGSLGAPNGPGTGSPATNGANGAPGAAGANGSNGAGGGGGLAGASGLLGVPNGVIATSSASVRLSLPHVLTRTYARRALVLPGVLQDAQGRPISGATLDVLAQATGGAQRLVSRATTAGDGSFKAKVPAGASRLVTVAYRPYSLSSTYAAQATLLERVGAGVTLRITPHSTGVTGTISLAGSVAGPLPRNGVVLDLLVHYRGRWQPIRTPRTTHGHFRVVYQFQGGRGKFPFKVQVLGGQAGFPYIAGYSRVVDVRTR
jgi:hypothetical protein